MYINVLVNLIFGDVLPPYTVSLSLTYIACEMVRIVFEKAYASLCYDPFAANHMLFQAIMFKERKSFADVGWSSTSATHQQCDPSRPSSVNRPMMPPAL